MKKNMSCVLLLVSFLFQVTVTGQNASFVNPFIGTARSHAPTLWGNHGGTYPGAVAPWGRVQLTPETCIRPAERGYYYHDTKIRAFSCALHRSGYPNGSTGQIKIAFFPGRINDVPEEYEGRTFSHQQEEAAPGYYSVRFDSGDRVEATARERSGLFRYSSVEEEITLVIYKAGKLTVHDKSSLKAECLHSVIRCNRPWDHCILRNDTAYLTFRRNPAKEQARLLVKIGTSTHSFDGSVKNMDAEIPGWDFDATRQDVYRQWDKELACVQIEPDDYDNKVKFYTALYHSFLMPWIISDIDGKYYQDGQTQTGNAYGEFSTWDTFRSLHPLLSLLKPERQKEMIRSAMEEYRTSGTLPKGPMTGMHTIPVLADAYIKDATDEKAEELYQAMKASYKEKSLQELLHEYDTNGYLDASREQSVSITSEYAYDDWSVGHFARLTGRTHEAEQWLSRSFNYRHLFDEQTLFLLPKDANGFLRNSGELGYQESNRWTASCFVPHNIKDLINLSGGDDLFVRHLQDGYDQGKILHDNEPVFHYPYLFAWAGRPDITAQIVRRILNEDYSSQPGGIPGNDDLGSTSSWFVLSAMGLYPACPGTGEYILTPPLFSNIRILLQNGKTVSLSTKGGTEHEPTYPSLSFNGTDWKKMFITHADLANGGELVYNYNRPVDHFSSFERPFSETKEEPAFTITSTAPASVSIYPNQTNQITFHVRNTGATGSFMVCLYDDTACIASRRVMVEQGKTVTSSIPFILYKKGRHTVRLGSNRYTVTVMDSARYEQPLICTQIMASPLQPVNQSARWQFTCKNITGGQINTDVPVLVNGQPITGHPVSLAAGEDTTITLSFTPAQKGFMDINILDCKKRVKAYASRMETCLLDLDYENKEDALCITDHSGFGNHGKLSGNRQLDKQGSRGTIRIDKQSYIAFPLSESLQTVENNQLTMATWIYPQEPPQGAADFFTKGDYSLLKMGGAHRLVFFSGGWGRGECQVTVPDDWYTSWHHIAGVCTGNSIKLYIDGKLMQEIPVDGKLSETELPWILGRNAEMPYARFSDMKFGATRIYGTALSDDEINLLFTQHCRDFKE